MAKKVRKTTETTLRRRLWSILRLVFGVFFLWLSAVALMRRSTYAYPDSLAYEVFFVSWGLYLVFGYLVQKGFATEKEMTFLRSARVLLLVLLTVAFLVGGLMAFLREIY